MGEIRNAYAILFGNSWRGRSDMKYLGIERRLILEQILRKQSVKM
jgi:hypothetical protein